MTAARHLLAVNFRDPAHPEAGGAELHLEEILLEAVRQGWRVTWLVNGFVGAPSEAEHRGMRIVRRGDWWNFNLIVPKVLREEFSGANRPDLIVEDINKVPCFVGQFTDAPVAVIIPHLFGTTAFQEANALIAAYVVALEKMIPAAYARSRFLVISESTRDDLVARGVPSQRVAVVHCGLNHERYFRDPAVPKTAHPSLVFVGRLRRYKGLDWVIRTLPRVRAAVPGVKLAVVGDGPWQGELVKQAAACGVSDVVEFRGFVPAREKVPLLQSAWALVQPSPKEGWGLTVVEAGACGTAVVAADSPGLRDSVRRDQTGLLVPYGDDGALAAALVRVLGDEPLRASLAGAGVEWAARFRWDDCARRSLAALTGEC
ncbi:MAG: glycosyltransferase family 4 protein [Candidatus Eisenbacteria bacterium]|nr:glycosyltransferase family 4 protein [Candidatus Eisenbacteria bacterium]